MKVAQISPSNNYDEERLKMKNSYPPFSEVWKSILAAISSRGSVETLAHGIKNDGVGVGPDKIKVRSEST